MSIITTAEFKKYANKRDEDAVGESLYQVYIDSAESVVSDYLGYNPASANYVETHYGDGVCYLALKAWPITLTAITVDGVSKNILDYVVDDEIISQKNGEIFPVGSLVIVSYVGGWSPVPGIIKVTILEIAALLSMEAGENIGVTGTSFDGGNTRTFLNYTRFDKYLSKLTGYRIIRLPRVRP